MSTAILEKRATGWSGGQWSLVRTLIGIYLALHFGSLIPWAAEIFSARGALPDAALSPIAYAFPNLFSLWDEPAFVVAALLLGVAGSALFAAGSRTRLAALSLWYLWACLLGRDPLIANPGIPYVGWTLLLFAALPGAPYGSVDAIGARDPGQWRLPRSFWRAAWIVMALGYTYSGLMKLTSPSWIDGSALSYVLDGPLARDNPLRDVLSAHPGALRWLSWGTLALEIGAAPLALIARIRPLLWTALVGLHVGIIATVDFADLTLGMLVIHAITFDPAWLPKTRAPFARERIVFDGACGLCHGFVRFVLAEDRDEAFYFEAGEPELDAIEVRFDAEANAALRGPEAVAYVLRRLGGLWWIAGAAIGALPASIAWWGYGRVAKVRRAIVAPPAAGACPVPPERLRGRWL